jgi:hypothetical protein
VADGKEIRQLLTLEDVKNAKKLYQTWWEANKGKSVAALQRDWKEGKGALAGAPNYKWL